MIAVSLPPKMLPRKQYVSTKTRCWQVQMFLCFCLESCFSFLAFTLRLLILGLCLLLFYFVLYLIVFRFQKIFLRQNIYFNRGAERKVKSAIWEPFWDFGGSQNRPLEQPFRPRNLQKMISPNSGARPGAHLAATWRRKRSKDPFSCIRDGFCSIAGGF